MSKKYITITNFVQILKALVVILIPLLIAKDFQETHQYYIKNNCFDYTLFILAWVSSTLFFLIISFSKNNILKILIAVLLLLFMFIVDVCYVSLNNTLTAETISLFWNERSYFNEAIITYWNILLFPLLRFIILLIFTFLPSKNLYRIKNYYIILLFLISFISIYILSSKPNGKGMEGLPPHIAPIPYMTHLLNMVLHYETLERKEVSIPITNSINIHNINTIILIVDESVRGDFIDINYNRDTTPYLLLHKDKIINFGLAVSSYNRSNGSHVLLRMGINPKYFISKDGFKILFSNPLIWQYAHKAGYKTIYIDAQKTVYQNYMDKNEAKYINQIIWIKPTKNEDTDHIAAKKLKYFILQPYKKFIYVVKSGCHFPYETRCPENEKIFKPTMTLGFPTNDRLKLINSYRNAVRWSVDKFFDILLRDTNLEKTVIVYTSDHGQNLFDENTSDVNLRHGTNKNSKIQEVIVPMFVITEHKQIINNLRPMVHINFNKCTHFQIFPTLLYLMGYDKNIVTSKYYVTLFDPNDIIPGFSNGNLRFGTRKLIKIDKDLSTYIDLEIDKLIRSKK